METRLCASCGRRKTIRGIWYLTPTPGVGAGPFVCETCFHASARAPASA